MYNGGQTQNYTFCKFAQEQGELGMNITKTENKI